MNIKELMLAVFNAKKYNFRENQQQPIQNIINTHMPLNNLFMAPFLKENEKVEEMFVNHKPAFIDLFKKELKVKRYSVVF